jgi:hypothetical protein
VRGKREKKRKKVIVTRLEKWHGLVTRRLGATTKKKKKRMAEAVFI